MPKKTYETPKNVPMTACEPAVVYEVRNPNIPFLGTQEEWWEHFHHIEKGNFTSLKEANREFEAWKKDYLASRLK